MIFLGSIRKAVLIFVISAYSASLGSIFVPHLYYYFNRQYIAEKLCENKDKPEVNCCGKCVLNKEISKAEKEEKKENTGPRTRFQAEPTLPIYRTQITIPGATHLCFPELKEKIISATLIPATPPPKYV